jgi:hypothetical protein
LIALYFSSHSPPFYKIINKKKYKEGEEKKERRIKKEMPTIEEQIKAIEEEIKKTPYNKATQHHIGKLKAKLAKLKEGLRKRRESGKSGASGFSVKKTGDATIALIGFPSVGKSTLLNKLTNAESRVESFDFTTLEVIPGIMEYEGARIQILDIPGLISGASIGKGRGREILSIARNSDLILVLLDTNKLGQLEIIEKELYESGIRLNEEKPSIQIKRTPRGGIKIFSSIKNHGISIEEVRGVLNANGIFNAEVTIREKITLEEFIDAVLGNRVYLPSIVAINKIDLVISDEKVEELKLNNKGFIPISAKEGINLEKLKEEIFRKLKLIRIYLKPQGKKEEEIDRKKPLILKEGSTIKDLCKKIHKDFLKKFRYARISGPSVKFSEEKVGLTHELRDKDVVTIIKSL